MLVSFINCILYTVIYICWVRNKQFGIGTIFIPFMYMLTAYGCLYSYINEPNNWRLTILPYIYLFIVYCILIRPFKYLVPQHCNRLAIRNETCIRMIVYFYMLMAILTFLYSIQGAINALKSGDWLAIRNELYYGEFYYSGFQRLYLNSYAMLNVLAEVYLFFRIATYNGKIKNLFFIILLAFCVYAPEIVNAIQAAARGTLFSMCIRIFIVYSIYSLFLSKIVKKVITLISLIFLFLFLLLVIAITFSRFDTDAIDSLIYYFGHSMNTFNYGVMDTQHTFGGGRWFLGNYYESIFGGNAMNVSYDSAYGTHMETSFITTIGVLYVDFGPIFTIIIALMISKVFSQKSKYGVFDIAHIYLYVVYAEFMVNGIFVEGKAYGMKLLIKLLLFFFISNFIFQKEKTWELVK